MISLGIWTNLPILFVGILTLTNWFFEDSESVIKAAKFKLRLLIKGNGWAGSTTSGVSSGNMDDRK